MNRKYFTMSPDQSLGFAKELMQRIGKPVVCDILGDHHFEVTFENGETYLFGGFTVGYAGTGPTFTHLFLVEAGFDVSRDAVISMQTPITLRK